MNETTIERRPAIAGTFYEADAEKLHQSVEDLLAQAQEGIKEGSDEKSEAKTPKILIAPHAGHQYSGPLAAKAYALWRNSPIKKVIILAPCHRVGVNGIALSSHQSWRTPLGQVALDQDGLQALDKQFSYVNYHDEAHKDEHAIEVHLPFLQDILNDFTLLPLLVGQVEVAQTANVIDTLWGGDETGIIISTDLSHFLTYNQCNQLDSKTAKAIEDFSWHHLNRDQACGRAPLSGLLSLKNRRNLKIERLGLMNSGDRNAPKNRVVGYGSWAVYEDKSPKKKGPDFEPEVMLVEDLAANHGVKLMQIAHQLLQFVVTKRKIPALSVEQLPPIFQKNMAVFVTLESQGQLRGCIGSLTAYRSLAEDLCHNVYAAAMNDPRFEAVLPMELPDISLSLSLLTAPKTMQFKDEAHLIEQIRPFKDGLILIDGQNRSTFLPQVWEQIPDKVQFLASLKQKAGLPSNHWSDQITFQRYQAIKIS